MLLIVESHPVQYHAPVYRYAAQVEGVPLTVVYGSDFSVQGYRDVEFGTSVRWDTDLLGGYAHFFLSCTQRKPGKDYGSVRAGGYASILRALAPRAALVLGYSSSFDRAVLRQTLLHGVELMFRGEVNDLASSRGPLRALTRDLALRTLYKRCASVLPLGQRAREHYRRLGVEDRRMFSSPYCVALSDTGETRDVAALRASLGLDANRYLLLFSGKLVSRKGIDLLPAGIAALPIEWRSRLTLVFVGAGERADALEEQLKAIKGLEAKFLGFRNQSELADIYAAVDALVLPSISGETWGLVVNEALSFGKPALVSDRVGCAPDLVESGVTGEVFQSANAADLALKLARLLSWCRDRAVAERCRARVADYSVAAAGRGIANAWRALA